RSLLLFSFPTRRSSDLRNIRASSATRRRSSPAACGSGSNLNSPLGFEGRGTMPSMVEGLAAEDAPPPHFVRFPSPAKAGEDLVEIGRAHVRTPVTINPR